MTSRVLPVVAAAVLLAACARTPVVTTAMSAPAPPGPPTAQAVPQGAAAAAPEALPAPPAARHAPPPSAFAAARAFADVHFAFDRDDIRPAAARALDAYALWLDDNARALVLVEGHADERGTNEYNLALGERRARATANYLASRGVANSRITTISYGEERPLCTAHTEACWARNRRAHFLVKTD